MLGFGALTTRFRCAALLIGAASGSPTTSPRRRVRTSGLAAAQLVNALFIAAVAGPRHLLRAGPAARRAGPRRDPGRNTFPIGAIIAGPLFGLSAHFGYRSAFGMGTALLTAGLLLLVATGMRLGPSRAATSPTR